MHVITDERRCRDPFDRSLMEVGVERGSLGLTLIVVGIGLALIGVLAWMGALSWFGRLPGDIRVERPGVRFYAPITSMVLISIAISLIAAAIRRWF